MANKNNEVLESNETTYEVAEAKLAVPAAAFNPDDFKSGANNFLSTMPVDGATRAEKAALYNAISNAEHAIGEMIGETITVEHMIAHPTQLVDEETGEVRDLIRLVLVSPEGEGYHSMSGGVVESMKRLCQIVGQGSWTDEPLQLKIKQVTTKQGNRTFNLVLVG